MNEPTAREALRAWIDRRCENDRAAARLLRVHFTYLSQILRGRRSPGLANAVRIQHLTGVPATAWVDTDGGSLVTSMPTKRRKINKGKA